MSGKQDRTWTVYADGEKREVLVPADWELIRSEEYRSLQAAATLLSDLDRSKAGRHKGDAEGQDPSGVSQGNPYLKEGQRIGTTISGSPIVYPSMLQRADLSDASLWTPGKKR
jgi:hypothetical protein